MYEFIILSLLMCFPLHGYLITKIANDKVGPWLKISNGTLYPLLARLEKAGLIAQVNVTNNEQDRHLRTFTITQEGIKRFHQLMIDTSNLGDYQRLFRLKVVYLDLISPREQLYLLNHYQNYCQASIFYLKGEAENLANELAEQKTISHFHNDTALSLIQHMVNQWQAEVDWILGMREKVVQQIENEQPLVNAPTLEQ